MDREVVLVVLTLALGGIISRSGVFWPVPVISTSAPAFTERRCWRFLWMPFAPVVAILAAVAGWAALEPSCAEVVPLSLVLASVPFGFVWTRAVWRAGRAIRERPRVRAAGVVGLIRPRIVVSETFRQSVDEHALAAALAHEAAHLRHRDPLRLWVAQFITDLQWPSCRAAERLRAWIRMLEFARDDDARRDGAEGADLAAAILVAVRLHETSSDALSLTGDALDLDARIRRLLILPPAREPLGDSCLVVALVVVPVLVMGMIAGAVFGEVLVRTVFGVLP